MKLRTLILLFLFLFGLTPLLAVLVANVPLVIDKLELFYHKAYLQNLRADFRDLDQHIARRHEMVRLLAKLPEPGMLISPTDSEMASAIEKARSGYTQWTNQVLFDQLDVVQILFIDQQMRLRFWLERDSKGGMLVRGRDLMVAPSAALDEISRKLRPGEVFTGPISFNTQIAGEKPWLDMTLDFISPIIGSPDEEGRDKEPRILGMVVVTIDVGGLANAYRGNYWVRDNGEYLSYTDQEPASSSAFRDFPGLESVFKQGELGLWEDAGQQVFWVPLFRTEGSGKLWVGRSVDPSPITAFLRSLQLRVASIVIGLLVLVLIIARLIAVRAERFSKELTGGIARVLEDNEPVEFSWKRPEELRVLGEKLTRLADTHARHTASLRSHAQALEESNRYKSQFLANVSHELRTPLNSILLLSKILSDNEKRKLREVEARQARVIYGAGSELRALIDNILDLSRIEARKVDLELEKTGLEPLLNDLLELMRPQFDEKGLELKLELGEEAPRELVTDADKLRQILINFLSNAVKFTETGGVTVQLQANRNSQSDRYPLRISVRDTGIGIPGDKQDVVFEAFKQADGSTSRRFGGTGLGLTISREIAGLIGGQITIESEEGKGSVFSLLLPLEFEGSAIDSEQLVSMRTVEEVSPDQPIPVADYHGRRVLVVDDDMRNLLALTPLLEGWGIEVTAAGGGIEAMDTLAEDDGFDLVLLDLMMPEMDGFDIIEQIRGQPQFRDLPIVVLSARAGEADRDRSLSQGAAGFLVKPVSPVALKEMLDRYLAIDTTYDAVSDGYQGREQ